MFNSLFEANRRLSFKIIIGTNNLPVENLNIIIHKLNKIYGGLTYSEKIGTWNETAVNSLNGYNSEYATETAHYIEICTDNLNESENMGLIKNAISQHIIGFANWVHVESYTTNGLHFSAVEHMENAEITV